MSTIMIAQFQTISVVIYYQAFPRDKSFLKVLVYSVYVLEAAQTFLLMENAWRVYAAGFGNIDVFDQVETSWLSVGILGGLGALSILSKGSKMTSNKSCLHSPILLCLPNLCVIAKQNYNRHYRLCMKFCSSKIPWN